MAASTCFLRKVSATEFRVYMRLKQRDPLPSLPLWQVFVFRQCWKGKYATPQVARDVGAMWTQSEVYLTHLMDYSDTAAVRTVWGRTDWTLSGMLVTQFLVGADDARYAGKASNDFCRAGSSSQYAEYTFTVPAAWAGGALVLAHAFGSTGTYSNVAGRMKIELFDAAGNEIPLNGRGIGRVETENTKELRKVRFWTILGVSDQAAVPTTAQNVDVEVARHLRPGVQYRVRLTSLNGSSYMAVGRGLLLRENPSLVPGQTNVDEYFAEYAADAAGTNVQPGSFCFGNTGTNESAMQIVTTDADFIGGVAHAGVSPTSFTMTADGVAVVFAGLATGYYGPYNTLTVTVAERAYEYTASATCKGAGGGSTGVSCAGGGSTTITALAAGANFNTGGITAGDVIRVGTRTDGTWSAASFQIVSVDSDTEITVTPAPGAAFTDVAWDAWLRMADITRGYTFQGNQMDITVTFDWLRNFNLFLNYVANFSPQVSDAYRPLHPTGVTPYDATHYEYVPADRSIPAGFMFPNSRAADVQDFLVGRRIVRYENVEGREMRSVGRIAVIDTLDFTTWIGGNLQLAANGSKFLWSTGQKKLYCALHQAVAPGVAVTAAEANNVCRYSVYFADPSYFTALQGWVANAGAGGSTGAGLAAGVG